jgi:hypothetical protein
MNKLYYTPLLLLLLGCRHPLSVNERRLADSLAVLRKLSNFAPLSQQEAYNFLNNYYLPRLDSMPTKRKIFIHPIVGFDFKESFNEDSIKLAKEFAENSSKKDPGSAVIPPRTPSLAFDNKFYWDSKLLSKTIVINYHVTNSNRSGFDDTHDNIKAWHGRYGYGYMCISYPQYNSYSKILVMREWIENDDWCGTGRETKFCFTKTAGGWKAY